MRMPAPSPQESFVINSMILMQASAHQDYLSIMSDAGTAQHGAPDPAIELPTVTSAELWQLNFILSGATLRQYSVRRLPICSLVSDSALFQQLVEQWRAERGATSSITEMMLSPAYQRIIGMGHRAIPFIIRQLEIETDDPDHWGWALHAITGEDPVPPEAAGDTVQIAQAWLEWARLQHAG